MANLIIIRGLPGSGKSTLGNFISNTEGYIHVESDMFFIDEYGIYTFDTDLLEEAHHWCLEQTRKALRVGDEVVVSNTFIRPWELEKYLELEPSSTIYECTGKFESEHMPPDNIYENMKLRFASKEDIEIEYPLVNYKIKEPVFYD